MLKIIKIPGGGTEVQRTVWNYVATLNRCVAWHERVAQPRTPHAARQLGSKSFLAHHMCVLGQDRSVRETCALASYLIDAVEYVTRQHIIATHGESRIAHRLHSHAAHAFRADCVARMLPQIRPVLYENRLLPPPPPIKLNRASRVRTSRPRR